MTDHDRPTMNDGRIERWLDARAERAPSADAEAVLRRTLQQIPVQAQRRRWPSLPWSRGAGPRRSPMMSTPIALATSLIIAATVSFALLADRVAQEPSVAPAAALPGPETAGAFSGSYGRAASITAGTVSIEGLVRERRGELQEGIAIESTDERFSGTMTFEMSDDWYDNGALGTFWGPQTIANDEGSWIGSVTGGGKPRLAQGWALGEYLGDGAYAGLSALVIFDSGAATFEGFIFPGSLPPRE